jgi:hypothetical protein
MEDLLRSKLEGVPNEKILQVTAKLLGYKRMPADIRTFVTDPYYLGLKIGVKGGLFTRWMEILEDVFPTPIHTRYPYLVFSGAIGIGKSFVSLIIAKYMLHRLDCLDDMYASLGIAKNKEVYFDFVHTNTTNAYNTFIYPMRPENQTSPYFNNLYSNHPIKWIIDGEQSNNTIGKDVIFYCFSEANFAKNKEKMRLKINDGFTRLKSRFASVLPYWGVIIIDTSARDDSSLADDFIQNNYLGSQVKVVRDSQWEFKKCIPGLYFNHGSFWVYAGDAINTPFIITDKEKQITDRMDPDRVIEVPNELKSDFQTDITKALQDLAGISTRSTNKYLEDPTNFMKCIKFPSLNKDVIQVEFNDIGDKILNHLQDAIFRIPRDRTIFIHLDLGITSDYTGMAVGYFDRWVEYDGKEVKQPVFTIPVAVAISRYKGQQTSILHIYNFIMDLRKMGYQIGYVTFDTYQSRQLEQDLERENIPVKFQSVDKTDTAHNYFKNMVSRLLVELPENQRMINEFLELERSGHKYDHPKVSMYGGPGHKDISDAVVGVVHSIYTNLEEAVLGSSKYMLEKQSKALDLVSSTSNDKNAAFQNMLEHMF